MEASRRIAQEHICFSRFGCRHSVINDSCRIRPFLTADHINGCTVRPFFQLLSGRRAECVCSRDHNPFALIFQFSGQFTDRCSLSHTIDTDHKDNRSAVLKFICCLSYIHLLSDAVDQKLPALNRLFNVLFAYLFFQVIQDVHCSADPKISHDQSLFQFFIEIIIDLGKSMKNTVHSGYDIISCLCKS